MEQQLQNGIRKLNNVASRADVLLMIYMVWLGFILLGELAELAGFVDFESEEPGLPELIYGLAAIGYLFAFAVTAITVGQWIYRANANLHAAGHAMEYSPGSSVGWYFVPVACLYKPLGAMREIWNTSFGLNDRYGDETPEEVKIWWGLWIVGMILGSISLRMQLLSDDGSTPIVGLILDIFGSALTLGAAWYIRQIIGAVTAAQSRLKLVEVDPGMTGRYFA